jgi:hypothetical protein
MIYCKPRRQLKQNRTGLGPKHAQSRFHQFNTVLAFFGQAFPMGDEFRSFPGKQKLVRRLVAPRGNGLERGGAVERTIDLRRRERPGIEGEPFALRNIRRVERAAPTIVGPT